MLLPDIPPVCQNKANLLQSIYSRSQNYRHRKYAQRIARCGEIANGIRQYCRVKLCPICSWRWQNMWTAKLVHEALPRIKKNYPRARFISMVFTVRNVDVKNLSKTLWIMNKSYQRLTQLRCWPGIVGWVRKREVSMSNKGLAHPHFHTISIAHPYAEWESLDWSALWGQSLRVPYRPVVHTEELKGEAKIHAQWRYLAKPGIELPDDDSTASIRYVLQLSDDVFRDHVITSAGALKTYLHEIEEAYQKKVSNLQLARAVQEDYEQNLILAAKEADAA